MARKIVTPEQLAEEASAQQSQSSNPVTGETKPTANGVAFINNYPNREFIVSPTRKLKFKDTRETFHDPEIIAFLEALVKDGGHRIFKVQDEPEPIAAITEPAQEASAPPSPFNRRISTPIVIDEEPATE